MAIRGLCIVKNEADILGQTLRAASKWCDQIYVFDNGSSDGTWDLVNQLAQELPMVVPFKQDPVPFVDQLRGEIFRAFKHRAVAGDWWGILDADEFYADDPREFLAAVPEEFDAVWPALYVYLFTDKDAAAYCEDPRRYADDVPIVGRMRYYVQGEYSELRFFRHHPALTDLPSRHWGSICPERIRLRHYGYRSPQQIQRRLETRREPMLRGEFIHEKRSNWVGRGHCGPGPAHEEDFSASWEERIADSSECQLDSGPDSLLPPPPWTPPRHDHHPHDRLLFTRAMRKLRRLFHHEEQRVSDRLL